MELRKKSEAQLGFGVAYIKAGYRSEPFAPAFFVTAMNCPILDFVSDKSIGKYLPDKNAK